MEGWVDLWIRFGLKSFDCDSNFFQKLLPLVEVLDLSQNRLESIDNLGHLSSLHRLVLSHNVIRFIPSLHMKLGNVTTLDLSHNKLESLEGSWMRP